MKGFTKQFGPLIDVLMKCFIFYLSNAPDGSCVEQLNVYSRLQSFHPYQQLPNGSPLPSSNPDLVKKETKWKNKVNKTLDFSSN